MVLDKLIDLEGRANRSEFWTIHLPTLALQLAALIFFGMSWIGGANNGQLDMANLRPEALGQLFSEHRSQILPIIFFPMLLQVSVAIRRMNDRGRPAWWVAFLVGPFMSLMLLGQPNQHVVSQSILTATALVLLTWYFIELGLLPGMLGAAERSGKSSGWVEALGNRFGHLANDASRSPAATEDPHAGAHAAVDRAVAERRNSDRRNNDRRVGMPDTREVKVERRKGDRRRAGERRGETTQGFGRRG
mgnify:CR=1 FL=1